MGWRLRSCRPSAMVTYPRAWSPSSGTGPDRDSLAISAGLTATCRRPCRLRSRWPCRPGRWLALTAQVGHDGAMRILSLLPSATEIVYALGLEQDLVGVTHECDWPAAARLKPIVSVSALPAASTA